MVSKNKNLKPDTNKNAGFKALFVAVLGVLLSVSQYFIPNRTTKRLALVMPVVEREWLSFLKLVYSWENVCEGKTNVDMVVLLNKISLQDMEKMKAQVNKARSKGSKGCFRNTIILSSNLTDAEDVYPLGPSMMFYKLVLGNVYQFTDDYDVFFWMEHDVEPLVKNWLDKLFLEAQYPAVFLVKGSLSRGNQVDQYVSLPFHRPWIGHINGNALYAVNEEMRIFAEMTYKAIPPTVRGNPWDTAMWLFLNKWMVTEKLENWRFFQRFAPRVLYSNFIQSYVGDGSSELLPDTLKNSIFLHGNKKSVGYRSRHE